MKYVVSNPEAEAMIKAQLPFRNRSGEWSGQEGWGGPDSFGSLPAEHRDAVRRAVYVVYSYLTPIGWVTEAGEFVVPDIGYSPTTGQHQMGTLDAWGIRRWPARGRELVPSGGGPRRGGIDRDDV